MSLIVHSRQREELEEKFKVREWLMGINFSKEASRCHLSQQRECSGVVVDEAREVTGGEMMLYLQPL